MIKVFTLNKNGKIELTKKELESLLNESYWEGYNRKNVWTYTSPYRTYLTTPDWVKEITTAVSNNPYKITNTANNSFTLESQGE